MQSQQEIPIDGPLVGLTLAAVLKRNSDGQSWTQVRQLIESRRVLVNQTLCLDEARRLTAGERITILGKSRPPLPKKQDLAVVHLDEHLIIVDKPAGLLAERRWEEKDWSQERKSRQPTLDELLRPIVRSRWRTMFPHREAARELPEIFAVHRLDRETSGLMLYALSAEAQQKLIREFAQHTVQRKYLAVVEGHPKARTIHTWLVRDRGDGLRGSLPAGQTSSPPKGQHKGQPKSQLKSQAAETAQEAITHIRPVERLGKYALIECSLETGRTHQIRIHLAETGHRLCGEILYTHALGDAPKPDQSGAPRAALHSCELHVAHPITDKPLHFASPLPQDLMRWIDGLRT